MFKSSQLLFARKFLKSKSFYFKVLSSQDPFQFSQNYSIKVNNLKQITHKNFQAISTKNNQEQNRSDQPISQKIPDENQVPEDLKASLNYFFSFSIYN